MQMLQVKIRITGKVQGVGFRPYLFRLSQQLELCGAVRNTGCGVELTWQGTEDAIDAGIRLLRDGTALPVLAELRELEIIERSAVIGEMLSDFRIMESRTGSRSVDIVPDTAPCPECLNEMRTKGERRYRYPFLNCTNCGPRFTIIRGVPYDRERTSMAAFPMCGPCKTEYDNVMDRRFHAQPVCCPACGPHVRLETGSTCPETAEAQNGTGNDGSMDDFAVIRRLQRLLSGGKIAAIKGLGGFHLACDAEDAEAVLALRKRKHREAKPLAVMCRDIAAVRKRCIVSAAEEKLLLDPARPIVILEKKDVRSYAYLSQRSTLGVMLPYTPLHELLFEEADYDCLVMTSANSSSVPVMIDDAEARTALKGIADVFLFHDREIENRCDDSLISVRKDGSLCFFRRSRGYAPSSVPLDPACCPSPGGILALGAEEKASFALGKGNGAHYSAHIGDLKNMETYAHYDGQIRTFMSLFGEKPHTLVTDLHPDFLSVHWAEAYRRASLKEAENEAENCRKCSEKETGINENGPSARLPGIIRVQHHHAHMASCMADNGLTGSCIGIIWDGTGLGEDMQILGSEILLGDYEAVERKGCIRPIPLAGGDLCMAETWRTALGLLEETETGCCAEFRSEGKCVPEGKCGIVRAQIRNRINTPLSSGMGRLFDGIYALITGDGHAAYEGEQAELLEELAVRYLRADRLKPAGGRADGETAADAGQEALHADVEAYPVMFDEAGHFDWRPMVREMLAEMQSAGAVPAGNGLQSGTEQRSTGSSREEILSRISFRFHLTLIRWAEVMCLRIREAELPSDRKHDLSAELPVVLSGGVFFNQLLSDGVKDALEAQGFRVYRHRSVSTGDEGIALGQLAIAANRRQRERL